MPRGPHPGWQDKHLVAECLRGKEQAWHALVDKYKNLVFAIALKYGLDQDDAADVFQSVWVDACSQLQNLRKQSSVRSWLISVTRHKCYHWRQKQKREALRRDGFIADPEQDARLSVEPVPLDDLEEHQLVREAIAKLSPRCQELIRLLFFSHPPPRYREIAEQLGLAVGSIGFIRGRCLKKLQKGLERTIGR